MPIKEIINYGIGVALAAGLVGNPLHFKENLKNLQLQILRECTRVDNWGNPSPWAHGKGNYPQNGNLHKNSPK